jgi:hypothetical protein
MVAIIPLHVFGMLYLLRRYRKHTRFYREARVADGVVVETRVFSSGEGPDHFARISYAVAGTQYMLGDGIWTERRRYERGQRVEVYYLPEAPESGRLADRSSPVIYIGAALLFAAVLIILLVTLLKELWK